MKHGFIRVAAATPRVTVADCGKNAAAAVGLIRTAASRGVRLLVLPELCVTAYTCSDLFLQQTLLESAEKALVEIIRATEGTGMLTAVGVPLVCMGKLYNCAAVIYDGRALGFVPKSHIPNYSEFYEYRHFTPAPSGNSVIEVNGEEYPFGTDLLFRCSSLPQFCVAAEICEDLWVPVPPSCRHAAAGATVIINLSASDDIIGKDTYRRLLVQSQSARLVSGYVYACAGEGESTTDLIFGGHNLIGENGVILAEAPPYASAEVNRPGDGFVMSELDVMKLAEERRRMTTYGHADTAGYEVIGFGMEPAETPLSRQFPRFPFVPQSAADRESRCEAILSMQSQGLKKRLEHSGAKSAVIAISGGLDSCLALLVSARAMDALGRPRSDITAVTMPCFGTTKRTRSNAEILCERLGVSFRCIDITAAVLQHFRDISHDEGSRNVVYENTQARERTQIIMDIANENGGIVVGTGDLSELALGWATYNGDHMSMYGVNSSVPKTLVRHIVKYFADSSNDGALSAVLYDILDTPVSPELLPADSRGDIAQKTEDIVGPYELHDFFLYHFVRFGFPPSKVYRVAKYTFDGIYDEATILKWLKIFIRRFFAQQFKRSCLPDGPKVGSVTLSPRGDWRMPSDASPAAWLAELEAYVNNDAR